MSTLELAIGMIIDNMIMQSHNATIFVDNFRELNSDPLVLWYCTCILCHYSRNEAINQPFSLEVKQAIRKLKNSKASGDDNEFFKHCHNDCIQIIVQFLNIVLNTECISIEWCLCIIHPLFN